MEGKNRQGKNLKNMSKRLAMTWILRYNNMDIM